MKVSRIRVGVAVCAAVAAVFVWASAVQAAVISHYTFDTDYSDAVGGNHALVAGGAPVITAADSQYGVGSLELNGTSWLRTGNWNLGGSFTVATWIKPANIAADWRAFLSKQQDAGQRSFWFGQQNEDGKIRFGNYFDGNGETAIDTGFALSNDQWYHVAATWDDTGDKQTVYVNGREVRQIARPGANQVVGNTPLQIGAVWGTNYFQGLLDEAWIFDEALSPQQLQNLAWGNDAYAAPARQLLRTLDFETGDMDGWYAVPGPGNNAVFIAGNMPTAKPTVGFDETTMQGNYFIRTWEGEVLGTTDAHTGIAETTPFVLGKNARFDFMIGGGNHPFSGDPDVPVANVTAFNLERMVAPADWEVVFTATGINGNYLNPVTWDASAYAGQTVRLRIYDTHTGGWGHIDVDSIRYSATQVLPESGLWSVDIQGTPSTVIATTMTGVESNYGYGKFWNAFVVAHHSGTSTDSSMALVDSNGNPTGAVFSIDGTVSGYNYAGDLEEDYLFINAGSADPNINWSITGLEPEGWYEMYVYPGHLGRPVNMLIDMDGDGDLSDEVSVAIPAQGQLFRIISADATGTILGSLRNAGAEGNWAGFQLRYIPEPSTFALLGLGLLGLVGYGWRRRKR